MDRQRLQRVLLDGCDRVARLPLFLTSRDERDIAMACRQVFQSDYEVLDRILRFVPPSDSPGVQAMPVMKFQVLHGQHIQSVDTGRKNENGFPIYEDKICLKDSVVDSEVDLTAMNGAGNMTPKFRRLDLGGRAQHPLGEVWDSSVETLEQFSERMRQKQHPVAGLKELPEGQKPEGPRPEAPPQSEAEYMRWLQSLTVAQLKDHAAAEEIDLKGTTHKDAIIKTIRMAQA